MNKGRRLFFSLAARSLAAGALAAVAARTAWAQGDGAQDFVPGEILVGVNAPEDRDSLIQNLQQNRQRYRTGNESPAGLSVEKSGGSSLKVRVEFSDNIKGRLRNNPSAELGLLQDLAQQIQANNPNIRFAHPNWIMRVDPIEAPSLLNRL